MICDHHKHVVKHKNNMNVAVRSAYIAMSGKSFLHSIFMPYEPTYLKCGCVRLYESLYAATIVNYLLIPNKYYLKL